MAKVFADDISLYTRDAPSLVYKSFRVDDSGGVENLKLDPGEAADITLVLRNAGSLVGPTTGHLVSKCEWLEVLDGDGAFGAAGEDETTASSADWFRVRALATAPVEEPAHCNLILSGSGYDDTVKIPIVVGDSMNLPAGPDAYGYRVYDYTDSCYSPRPDYDWYELRGSGTLLPLGDDETKVLHLPESFGTWRYYGRDYTRLSVCSNGFIAADSTDRCDFRDVILPYAGAPPNIVAFAWDNFDPTQGGAVWYRFDSAAHCFIVEFDSVPYFAVSGMWEKVEVLLYDRTVPTPTGDNSIVIQYHTLNYPQALSVGLQNFDGSVGLCHTWNDWYPRVSAPLKAGTALRLEPVLLTGVEEPAVAGRAAAAWLIAWPNPSRGRTFIALGPGGGAGSTVRLFDSSGRLVRVLAAQSSVGNRQSAIAVVWDGRDGSGRQVAPGLYFAQAGAGDAVQKLVLLR
jgi:hypothetical protein